MSCMSKNYYLNVPKIKIQVFSNYKYYMYINGYKNKQANRILLLLSGVRQYSNTDLHGWFFFL